MDLCFLRCLHDAAYSVKSIKIPVAPCPEIRNPTFVHLQNSYCTFVTILLRLFPGLSSLHPACVQTSTSRRLCNPIQTQKLTSGRMSLVTRYFGASTFQEVFARLSVGLPRRTPVSVAAFFRRTSTSWCWWLRGWSGFWCRLRTIVTLVPETALVSYRALSFCFPLKAFSSSSFNTTLTLQFVTTAPVSILSFLASKLRIRTF